MLSLSFKTLLTLTLLSAVQTALSVPAVKRAAVSGPVLDDNFPDPSVIEVDGVWYAFATNGLNKFVPTASSSDFGANWKLGDEALPKIGAWSSGHQIWAPDVLQVADGSFVMYYTAQTADKKSRCVGAARSKTVMGPYEPEDEAIACAEGHGGAIDPAGFIDDDGTVYVVYKVDGKAVCGNNSDAANRPTPLMIIKMEADGVTKAEKNPTQLLDRDENGPLTEAPSLVRASDGTYVLFYSTDCYAGASYTASYATASSIKGPYKKAEKPLLATGSPFPELYSPGGADVTPDGTKIVFHADAEKSAKKRLMYTADIKIEGGVVTIV